MPKYAPSDELKRQLAEPLEFELKGEEFVIPVITTEMQEQISKLDESENQMNALLRAIIGQEAFERLHPFDVRELNPLLLWFAEQVNAGLPETAKKSDGPSPP